jgi:hypothetical protein
MHDIKFIRENAAEFDRIMQRRGLESPICPNSKFRREKTQIADRVAGASGSQKRVI